MDPTSPEGAPSVEYLAEKMARAVVWKEKFIVGAIGSSVTAGHDNCAYDSYENQLERTMAKVWEAAGVEWEVRNAGEGGGCGDSFRNQIFCTRQMVGDDVVTPGRPSDWRAGRKSWLPGLAQTELNIRNEAVQCGMEFFVY